MQLPVKNLFPILRIFNRHKRFTSTSPQKVAETNKPQEHLECVANLVRKPPQPRRGLVLGVYSEDPFVFTGTTEEFDCCCKGKLKKLLSIAAGRTIKNGQTFLFYDLMRYHTVCVVGVAKKFSSPNENFNQLREAVRNATGKGCRILLNSGIAEIDVDNMNIAEAAAEGSYLSTYRFREYRKIKAINLNINVAQFGLNQIDCDKWQDGKIKAQAQNIARRLQNMPANILTPTYFAEYTKSILNKVNITKIQIYDKKWIEQQKMFAFLSVSKGSAEEPKFMEIHYGDTSKKPFVLVGKGVTFDSGGICLKPCWSMADMKGDMGGAAVVIGALYGFAKLDVKAGIVALIPLTENMPSGKSYKPGDVCRAMNGKSIGVTDTDFEGRLLLADALSYSTKFKPKCLLNVATIANAMSIALGNSACGFFTNSNRFYDATAEAAAQSGDRIWRFPLWNFFSEQITKCPDVDVNNVAKVRFGHGAACTAAAFLKEFIPENTEWGHIDMSNVMGRGDMTEYLRGQSLAGRPTRTIIELLISEAEKAKLPPCSEQKSTPVFQNT